MKNFKSISLISLLPLVLLNNACDTSQGNLLAPHPGKAQGSPHAAPKARSLALADLTQLGFRIPHNQNIADALPPQPNSLVHGIKVKGGPGKDTNWTAFTLVLFLNANGQYEILTQKRAIPPKGKIESPGGHLTGGQTWKQGAQTELQQEAGIIAKSQNFFYLEGGNPRVSKAGNLYGNANFFVVFADNKPKTSNHSHEVDKQYGHQWLPLMDVYNDVKNEQNAHPAFGTGKYYDFFRTHLIHFVENVLP